MKLGPQVYVVGSIEAAARYCRAFGAEIGFHMKAEDGNYAHCELMVDGSLFLALSEAPFDCDHNKSHVWQNMAFNVYDMGSREAVRQAFDVLSEGGTVLDALGPCPWNEFCANVIDKYGVFWWIAI